MNIIIIIIITKLIIMIFSVASVAYIVHDLLAHGVVPAGEVVGRVLLAAGWDLQRHLAARSYLIMLSGRNSFE